MEQDYAIANGSGVKIGAISHDRAYDCWWIMGGTERFRTEPDAFSYWLANYDHETGVLREPDPSEPMKQTRILGDAMPPSYLE